MNTTEQPKIVVITDEVLEEAVRAPEKFGLQEQKRVADKVSALEKKIVFYAKDEATKPITDQLYSLQQKLEELNPKYYEEKAPFWKKLLHLVPKGEELIKLIAEKYETIGQYIERISMHLSDSKDQIIRDNIELERLQEELKQFNKELEEKIGLGKQILEKLKERAQIVDDPVEKKRIEGAIFTFSTRIQDLQTILQANLQFLVSIEQTLQNNRALLDAIERTITITKTVLTIGLSIRTSLINQKRAMETVKATQEYTAELLKSNAEAIKGQTKEIESLYTSPVVAINKLEEAYNTLMSAITDFEEVRRRGIEVATQNIAKLEEMNKKLKEKLEQ
ncbi:MAG: toxic anion resistance protein [Desulfurobacteriaceae bacterium]